MMQENQTGVENKHFKIEQYVGILLPVAFHLLMPSTGSTKR